MDQSVGDKSSRPVSAAPSIEVDRLPARTVAPHGMTGPELTRLNSAIHFMELFCQRERGLTLWIVHVNKATTRAAISDIQKRITRLQVEHCGRRPYNVT